MKKILMMATLVLALAGNALAFELPDWVRATLIDHVALATQVGDGNTRGAFVDSVLRIGRHEGRSIFDVQLGFTGVFDPDPGQVKFGNFVVGGILKANTFTTDKLNIPDHWVLLNSIEHGPHISYDTREKEEYFGYQIGVPFQPKPKE